MLRHPRHCPSRATRRPRARRRAPTTRLRTSPRRLRDRPAQLQQITDPGLCHGWAGLYQTVWRAARDATTPALHQVLPALGEQLHQAADTGHSDGFLDGRAGTALALATHTTNQPPATGWDACLLID
ncbi:lanthionine synthetase LanC family protein [Kitasatospora sp. NPDC058032]|uniref:lanthionine synthetase LanC family protein n=1 Tax=Kitasatospora sp. NPDC058032 TaxID=3346307 RepID=UPI0036DA81BE